VYSVGTVTVPNNVVVVCPIVYVPAPTVIVFVLGSNLYVLELIVTWFSAFKYPENVTNSLLSGLPSEPAVWSMTD